MVPVKCPVTKYKAYRRRQLSGAARRRDYVLERACYHSRPAQRRKNNARHRVRHALTRSGVLSARDGIHIHHKNRNPLDNRMSNIVLVSSVAHRRIHSRKRK